MSIKMIFASAAALAMVAGTPAFAAKGSGQQSASADGGYKAKGERKKCRTFENSAMRTKRERLCLTTAEWKKFDESR
jgi:hypothetical protein